MSEEQRIRIETGLKTPASSGGSAWSTTSSVTRWAEVILISAIARERYQSIDKQVDYEFRFNDRQTITMRKTRFVWVTNGHPNNLKIYYPAAPAENVDGEGRMTTVLVTESTEVADE